MHGTPRFAARITGRLTEQKVKHHLGFPPELTEGKDERQLLEPADFVVIGEAEDGFYLNRFTTDGRDVGDTWHMTLEDARHQAQFEYGDMLSDWISVPANVDDVISFCRDAEV